MLDEHSEALLKKCMRDAFQGEKLAMRLCVERLLPPRRDGNIQVASPRLETLADVRLARQRNLRAIQTGAITPAEGESIARVIELLAKGIQAEELQMREQSKGEATSAAVAPFIVTLEKEKP